MARRYARDNRGRFSSTGATARGGRLRTASGKKRATQTKAIAAVKPAGTVDKPKGLKPSAIKPKAANAVKAATSTTTRQARAAANVSRTNAAKPLPGNRRLTKAQVRSQVRTESALKIYKGGEAAQREIRNARGLARTERARNNWVQTRDQRLANAKAASMPLVGVGMAQAAKGRAAKKPPMTKAEYEAAAQKAWGTAPRASTSKAKQSTDQQLDRLIQRSGNLTRSKTGLSKAEAIKAQELAKKTGRSIRVSQNPSGGYSIEVSNKR